MRYQVQNILDLCEQRNVIRSTSKDWLIAALDPFHDSEVDVQGYPDLAGDPTTVQCVRLTASVNKPSGVTTGLWDCNVMMLPEMFPDAMINGTVSNDGTFTPTSGATTLPFGFLNALAAENGGATFPTIAGAVSANLTNTPLVINDFVQGNARIIGAGFEVANTTSALNRQGAVTVYRTPAYTTPSWQPVAQSAGTYQYESGYVSQPWPGSINDAQIMPGATTWAAEDGAYVVGTFSTVTNPATACVPGNHLFGTSTSSFTVGNRGAYATNGSGPMVKPVPMNICGAYFTGLSLETTLQITLKVYVERAPSYTQPDLVVLASPGAPFDPLAFEIYALIARSMPAGVRLNENPTGEFFRKILSTLASSAGPIGAALSPILPIAGPIGGVVAQGAKALLGKNQTNRANAFQMEKPAPPPRKFIMGAAATKKKKKNAR